MIVSISSTATSNLGDLVSRPALYFDLPVTRHIDVREPQPDADLYIVGGGAVQRRAYRAPAILWGTGWTKRKPADRPLPGRPENVVLWGRRDYGQPGATWVPCASCMSPLFDREYAIQHPAVLYMNNRPDTPYRTLERPPIYDLPTQHNGVTFEEAVAFLGSGETIVTNSYHGAYWGTLLGRRVVIVNPYSSKFLHFRHQPAIARNWRTARPRTYPDALGECREANRAFYAAVGRHLTD